MKVHFERKEKELIKELCDKLADKVLDIDNMKTEITKLIGSNNFEIYRNSSNDISYYYILYYGDVEIGLDTLAINENQ